MEIKKTKKLNVLKPQQSKKVKGGIIINDINAV